MTEKSFVLRTRSYATGDTKIVFHIYENNSDCSQIRYEVPNITTAHHIKQLLVKLGYREIAFNHNGQLIYKEE